MKKTWKFFYTTNGNVALIAALIAPLLIGSAGVAIDSINFHRYQSKLQDTADSAALAAAKELTVANISNDQVIASAKIYANNNFGTTIGAKNYSKLHTDASVNKARNSITVELSYTWAAFFAKPLGYAEILPIKVKATAQLAGAEIPACVIGLDPTASETVSLDSNSRLTAANCSVHSNSVSTSGLSSLSNSRLVAANICSSGGLRGKGMNYEPLPIVDCPPVPDPLANRLAPPIVGCDENNVELIDKKKTILPGVYCGGLRIDGNSKITFAPGIYIIKDGMFNVDSNSQVSGEYVGFYLTGKNSTFRFASNSKVNFSAPKDGPLAGLLFFEDRNSPKNRRHEILSNYARDLVGTVYLSKGRFVIDADNPVADQSAYTAVVARRIELYSGPNLVLNTDYSHTDVPVPEGIAGANGPVRLIK